MEWVDTIYELNVIRNNEAHIEQYTSKTAVIHRITALINDNVDGLSYAVLRINTSDFAIEESKDENINNTPKE